MSGASESIKLAELRAKTDRQLVEIIDAELERGVRFAQVLKLLPKVEDPAQRRRLEAKLKRQTQDRRPARNEPRIQTACG